MRRRLVPLLTAGALLGALVTPTAVAQSHPKDEAHATVQATATADTRVTFLAGLPRDSAALDAAAVKRSTPGELLYRDHPSLTQAGKDFGAASRDVTRLRNVAGALGITATVDRGRILTRLTASVADWERAYGQRMTVTPPTPDYPYTTYSFPAGNDSSAYAGAPPGLRTVVQEMAAVYVEYAASADSPGPSQAAKAALQRTLADTGSPQRWPRNLGTLPAGTCNAPALAQRAVYAPRQIQTAYGTSALARKGVRGQGAHLTIVSLGGGYAAEDVRLAAECFGYDEPRIDVVRGTGVPQPFVNAEVQTHLDLIIASSVLPRTARMRLLEVPAAPIGFTEAFARMVDASVVPDAVSISAGGCEQVYTEEYAPLIPLNEDLLRMAAIVGTSVVVATGDQGTSECGADVAEDTGEPTTSYPSTSPWVTAVGGTRLGLRPDNTRRAERVWNDMPYVGTTVPAPAGGGGPSAIFDRPWWQSGATPQGPRTVPDVSVLAAIRPGWPLAYGGEIFGMGGTGAGASYVAASLAAMSAKQRDRGYPTIGFANAWLYAAAAGKKPPYFDVVAGTNEVQPVGCCAATRGYDMASGIGVPAMDRLYPRLPQPAG